MQDSTSIGLSANGFALQLNKDTDEKTGKSVK